MSVINECAQIVSQDSLSADIHLITLQAPQIAAQVQPGQFVHLLIPEAEAHILRRPYSVFKAQKTLGTIVIMYREVGFGSSYLFRMSFPSKIDLMGPVGTGWSMPLEAKGKRALIVAGGLGGAPLFMHCERLLENGMQVDVVLGAQNRFSLVCKRFYEELFSMESHKREGAHATAEEINSVAQTGGVPLKRSNAGLNSLLGGDGRTKFAAGSLNCATDDGSFGFSGFCTELAADLLRQSLENSCSYDYIACCGPEPVMAKTASAAAEYCPDALCEVSLERRMACGIGACLSCVAQTDEGLKRVCVDGPVFDAKKVVW